MDNNEIISSIISYLRPYNPERIGIFGSFTRKEQTPTSDIDILVKFRKTYSLLDLVKNTQNYPRSWAERLIL